MSFETRHGYRVVLPKIVGFTGLLVHSINTTLLDLHTAAPIQRLTTVRAAHLPDPSRICQIHPALHVNRQPLSLSAEPTWRAVPSF